MLSWKPRGDLRYTRVQQVTTVCTQIGLYCAESVLQLLYKGAVKLFRVHKRIKKIDFFKQKIQLIWFQTTLKLAGHSPNYYLKVEKRALSPSSFLTKPDQNSPPCPAKFVYSLPNLLLAVLAAHSAEPSGCLTVPHSVCTVRLSQRQDQCTVSVRTYKLPVYRSSACLAVCVWRL